MTAIKAKIDFDGKEYSLETGRFAKFAHGSVMVTCGETMVLVTVVSSNEEDPNKDFLPLQVEYREKTASAGKFPGGFLKREGRPSDQEVLASRLIDRPIRPLVPEYWRFETQLLATVYSADPSVDPETLGAVGSSAALMISDIPFDGPMSEVKVGRIDGQFIANPSFEQLKDSDIDMTVAGTDKSIVMVEGESNEISEEDFLDALQFAHEKIKQLNGLQKQLHEMYSVEKRTFNEDKAPDDLVQFVADIVKEGIYEFSHKVTTKNERSQIRHDLKLLAKEKVNEKFGEMDEYKDLPLSKYVSEAFSNIEKGIMRSMILKEGKRLDGRQLSDVRAISCEVGVLPRSHGSALFTRGETQSLTTVTLGTKRDEQMIDGLQPVYHTNFILHYNFPPFSTGEIKRLGLGRREIGHGNLALRALKRMMPTPEEFPYTTRVVSDILESNGSSSMATVCAGSLALFNAGVPIKRTVAGIAMGLIKEDEDIAILSDILGDEDHLGDMDFKVAGTTEGITAFQMDIKIDGISMDIMKKALYQAKDGRMHKISVMNKTISEPADDLSMYAPRFTVLHVPTESIGAVIGSGGETIRSICKETETEINIDDEGKVIIAATNGENAKKAADIIQQIIRVPKVGETFEATVKEIREGLGAFLEFLPGKTGLLHISQIANERVEEVKDVLTVGDKIEIMVIEVSRDGKFRLSRKAILNGGMDSVEPRRPSRGGPRDSRDSRDRDRGDSRDRDRGGSRDRDRRPPRSGNRY